MDFIVPFITGLTTGGLSCLAVQGGLLAGSIAHEVEQSINDRAASGRAIRDRSAVVPPARRDTRTLPPAGAGRPGAKAAGKPGQAGKPGAKAARAKASPASPAAAACARSGTAQVARAVPRTEAPTVRLQAARPIVLFLSAKLVAYTILGFLLGLLGSVLQLSTMTQAIMQAAIGIFMVGTALRMFNVHPIFRYFALEPPRFVTRYIRRKAKDQANAVTPLFLGALTILIPCGVTQAMMAVAIGTGNAVAGAVTMFAFILGTSPVFFIIAYLATRLGSRLEANFMRAVAIVVLVLGLVSIDAGLTLAGWPYSFSNLRLAWSTAQAEAADASGQVAAGPRPTITPPSPSPAYGEGALLGPPSPRGGSAQSGKSSQTANSASAGSSSGSSAEATGGNVVTINVAGNGYSPRVSHARANQPLQMALVTKNTGGCARAFVIPSLQLQKVLPATGTTTINVPAQKPGTKLYYSCSMGMYNGVIIFDA